MILTRHCSNFDEDLIYFFYGRPAYRDVFDPIIDDSYNPICLLFKPDCFSSIKRAYPFDSGAYLKGLYKQHINEELNVSDFELKISINELSRIVTAFFGNNMNYYFGNFNKNIQFEYDDFEAKAFYSILSGSGKTVFDDRGYTIEVQIDENVSLASNIIAVILPYSALQNRTISNLIIKEWQATPLTYETYRGIRPAEYNGIFRDLIKDFLKIKGDLF